MRIDPSPGPGARFIAARGSLAGQIAIAGDLDEHIVRSGLRILGLAPDHGLAVAALPMHHRDPFDRLLIAQARAERLTVLTTDARIARYDVPTIDARA